MVGPAGSHPNQDRNPTGGSDLFSSRCRAQDIGRAPQESERRAGRGEDLRWAREIGETSTKFDPPTLEYDFCAALVNKKNKKRHPKENFQISTLTRVRFESNFSKVRAATLGRR